MLVLRIRLMSATWGEKHCYIEWMCRKWDAFMWTNKAWLIHSADSWVTSSTIRRITVTANNRKRVRDSICGAAECGLLKSRKRSLCASWFTPDVDSTLNHSPPLLVKSSDRHDASHHTPSSVFIFYFFCTLMRFDTAQNKNSHCVCPPRVSGLRFLILISASAVGQQSEINMYSREMSVRPERAGCARGFEVNLSCHVTVKLDGCSVLHSKMPISRCTIKKAPVTWSLWVCESRRMVQRETKKTTELTE